MFEIPDNLPEECKQFNFPIERDMCSGRGTLGRSDPKPEHVRAWRRKKGFSDFPDGYTPPPPTTGKPILINPVMSGGKKPAASMSLFAKIKSFGLAAIRFFFTGGKMVTEAQLAERLKICEGCDKLVDGHCSICGCNCTGQKVFLNKLAHPGATCPDTPPKWGPVTG